MPDIADKELRGNFVKRMSKSQHQKKYENELLESKQENLQKIGITLVNREEDCVSEQSDESNERKTYLALMKKQKIENACNRLYKEAQIKKTKM